MRIRKWRVRSRLARGREAKYLFVLGVGILGSRVINVLRKVFKHELPNHSIEVMRCKKNELLGTTQVEKDFAGFNTRPTYDCQRWRAKCPELYGSFLVRISPLPQTPNPQFFSKRITPFLKSSYTTAKAVRNRPKEPSLKGEELSSANFFFGKTLYTGML